LATVSTSPVPLVAAGLLNLSKKMKGCSRATSDGGHTCRSRKLGMLCHPYGKASYVARLSEDIDLK
jgi:hypothetical protein